MSTDLSWVGQHQAIVAALIVFAGVIFGLVGNGLLQRWDRSSRRDHDREVMRTALLAELRHLVASYEYRASMMEAANVGFYVPVHTPTEVYDSLLDKIGLLTVDQAHKVIHAYLGAKHLPINLRRIAKEPNEEAEDTDDGTATLDTVKIDGDYVWVVKAKLPKAIRLHRDRIDLFKNAIDALRENR